VVALLCMERIDGRSEFVDHFLCISRRYGFQLTLNAMRWQDSFLDCEKAGSEEVRTAGGAVSEGAIHQVMVN